MIFGCLGASGVFPYADMAPTNFPRPSLRPPTIQAARCDFPSFNPPFSHPPFDPRLPNGPDSARRWPAGPRLFSPSRPSISHLVALDNIFVVRLFSRSVSRFTGPRRFRLLLLRSAALSLKFRPVGKSSAKISQSRPNRSPYPGENIERRRQTDFLAGRWAPETGWVYNFQIILTQRYTDWGPTYTVPRRSIFCYL